MPELSILAQTHSIGLRVSEIKDRFFRRIHCEGKDRGIDALGAMAQASCEQSCQQTLSFRVRHLPKQYKALTKCAVESALGFVGDRIAAAGFIEFTGAAPDCAGD
ncbi:hypothetical protein HQ945_00890 [Phyllobacterium sp. BT25]|uniref:Uncharacterized protein n=1 Tax=Phyllobacterium pellucidum TaxID=2740464 RepID=A0A849VP36_9HYPH|nr:hypothetical protein [Phyllobacterium pellucidum]NTS29797.1 hypothetical protein [Phyllobacterium pellucidum]